MRETGKLSLLKMRAGHSKPQRAKSHPDIDDIGAAPGPTLKTDPALGLAGPSLQQRTNHNWYQRVCRSRGHLGESVKSP